LVMRFLSELSEMLGPRRTLLRGRSMAFW
jgi:hypothetical protein